LSKTEQTDSKLLENELAIFFPSIPLFQIAGFHFKIFIAKSLKNIEIHKKTGINRLYIKALPPRDIKARHFIRRPLRRP
jgi:hypothetical protein